MDIDELCLEIIAKCPRNLETLGICNFYTDVPAERYKILADMPMMKHLQISYNSLLQTPSNMDELLLQTAAHNRLEFLDISRADMTSENTLKALERLTNLKILKLNHTWNCNDATLERISCCCTLRELHIVNSKVTSVGLKHLIERCHSIKYIDATRCQRLNDSFMSSCLKERTHLLEIVTKGTNIVWEEHKVDLLRHFNVILTFD